MLVAFLTLTLSAGPAGAQTGQALQPAGHAAPGDGSPPPRRHRIGLLAGGVVTFGISYLLSVMVAIDSLGSYNTCTGSPACTATDNSEARDLLIPAVGPWLAMGSAPSRDTGLLALLGIAQATGVALTIAGIVRYSSDEAPADGPGDASGARHARARPTRFITFGVLPTRDGAFGFLSGRM